MELHLEDDALDINDVLQEEDIWLEDLETDVWLMPGPMLDEGEQLMRSSTVDSNSNTRKQIASGPDSKRGARFKTQVIKYEEPQSLGGGDEDLDLEPPPSLSSLDDFNFLPAGVPGHVQQSRLNGLDATFSAGPPALDASFIVSHSGAAGNLPQAMTDTYNVETSAGGTLDAKPAAHMQVEHKNAYMEKIKAIRQKYATPKGLKTVISQVSESDEGGESLNSLPNKLCLVNQQLEEVQPDEGRRLSSAGKFLLNAPELGSPLSSSLNRLSLDSPSITPNRLSLVSPSITPNRLSLNSPVGANRTLTLNKLDDELLTDNKLSRMNENLFVATSPSPMVETKRFLLPNVSSTSSAYLKETATSVNAATNFTSNTIAAAPISDPKPKSSAIASSATSNSEHAAADPAVIPPKPKLKKQGTFEILDNEKEEEDESGVGDKDEDRYQTMVLPCVDGEGVNGNHKSEDDSPFTVSFSSTPKACKTISHQQQTVNSNTITKSNRLSPHPGYGLNTVSSLHPGHGLNTSPFHPDHCLNTSFTIERHEDFDAAAATSVKSRLEQLTDPKSYLTMTYLEDNYRSSKTNVSSTRLNSSFTYSREKGSSSSKSNTSVTYLNGGDHPNEEDLVNQNVAQSQNSPFTNNGLNTSYTKSGQNDRLNVMRSGSSNDLNRSYTVATTEMTEDESNEEFNATEAESNEEYRATEAHRNLLNKSFTLLNALENAVEESEHLNENANNVFGEGLNTSFTVRKHYDETITYPEQNGLDSNDNLYSSGYRKNVNEHLVNGKSRGNNVAPTTAAATSKTEYRTFTRRGKIPTGPAGAYRNGTSGLLQKKSLVRPSTGYGAAGANLNSTFTPPEYNLNETRTLNLNETVQLSGNHVARFGPSRYSTVTRSKDNTRLNPGVQDSRTTGDANETVNINRFSTITRPKSKLSYVGQKPNGTNRLSTVINTVSTNSTGVARCKNSSSTESLKSNESYVIARPNGVAPRGSIPKRPIYKSTGALNICAGPGPVTGGYSRGQSTDNLSVKSGGSDSDGSSVGGSSALPRPTGLVKPGFSRIPAPPSSRIPAAAKPSMLRPTSMLSKYSATRKV
uniref:Uncharacterized protein n=1 Tax=Cacopsylla melanoneura TaxID=428564 RepID=A0A8D8UXC4_9HEMI